MVNLSGREKGRKLLFQIYGMLSQFYSVWAVRICHGSLKKFQQRIRAHEALSTGMMYLKLFFFFSWLNLLWFSGKNRHSLLIPRHSFQPSLLIKIIISGSHSMYLLTPSFSRWSLLWVYGNHGICVLSSKKIMQDFEN